MSCCFRMSPSLCKTIKRTALQLAETLARVLHLWSMMLSRIPIIPNPAYIYKVSVVVCGDLRQLALYANHNKSPLKGRKYAEFGMMCIHVPVKTMACLFCVMHNSTRFQGDI